MKIDLDGGLILRSLAEGESQDIDRLPTFHDPDDAWAADWVMSYLDGSHPTVTLEDIWVIVDPKADDAITSSLMMIPQLWRYQGVDMPVGRIELVRTRDDYRRRGLIRVLMDAAHKRSEAIGHVAQVIEGLDHYYRRFGYAYAVDSSRRAFVPMHVVPSRPKHYQLRVATENDIPDLIQWDAYMSEFNTLTCARTVEQWHWEFHGNKARPTSKLIITDTAGEGVGYVTLRPKDAWCFAYVVGKKASYLDTFDDVLYGIRSHVADHARKTRINPPTGISFRNGAAVLDTLVENSYPSRVTPPRYACWYIRPASPAGLVHHISSVLESRLVSSDYSAFTG
jgi:GNAT superfamily N-acetyltransferase